MDELVEYLLSQTKYPNCPVSGIFTNFDRNIVTIRFKNGMLIELILHKEYEVKPSDKNNH
jgi:hypothetical protein